MLEIEKLYKNAGVERVIPDVCSNYEGDCIGCKAYIKGHKPYCTEAEYPPFTPEKQLSLIKWLINFDYTHLSKLYGADMNFSVVLAATINYLWKCLSKSEQEQIADILKG